MAERRVAVPGSERAQPPGAAVGDVSPGEIVEVTVIVRPRAELPDAANARARAVRLTRADFALRYGATQEDLAAVERFASAAGLTVTVSDAARRSVTLRGPAGAMGAAFGTAIRRYRHGAVEFRGRTGALTVPASLAGIVRGVHGLDSRPQARAHIRRPRAAGVSYTPPQIAQAYDFPRDATGAGETVALIELGGGYAQADIDAYFTGLGLAAPSVVSVGVDGAVNAPAGDPASADAEVLLDIEVVGGVAPGAAIVVYFAPNTDQGFLDAVTTAIHDTARKPSIVSISWGGPESSWTQQSLTNFDQAFAAAAMLGVTVTAASGDSGSDDGVGDGSAHVDFPSSSPHVLACGGTSLQASGTTIASETVWNDGAGNGATGGGVSDVFGLPAWQNGAGVPPSANPGGHIGRGVPDVAGDADPQTGYTVRVDGQTEILGGTSAVAPLWAGLIARLNQRSGKPLGFVNPALYANARALNDITQGSNGAYAAKAGWDACTGLGSPDGTRIEAALVSSAGSAGAN